MKTYIEIWKAKDAWNGLSKEERFNYLGQLAPAMQQLTANGVEILAWGENDKSTHSRAAYDFFAVWKFPQEAAVRSFESMLSGTAWYNYFEQVNVCGSTVSPDDIIAKMINA